MIIKSRLFSRGHPLKNEPGLPEVLEQHKSRTIAEIKRVVDISQLSDLFLEHLVKESIVTPLSIEFDKITKRTHTEELDASMIPYSSMGGRMLRSGDLDESELLDEIGHQRPVARLIIPFKGDPMLFKYAPSTCGFDLPHGEVNGSTVQFDMILWGSFAEDGQRLREGIKHNRELLASFADSINKQVKEFNESLPAHVKLAFDNKLTELTKQNAVFDGLGIPDAPEAPTPHAIESATPVKTKKTRAGQITQIVQNMYVQQLNQTNYNVGDVNNAIQSD